jgi:transcriptional regulator with XRE-family HTH domain
MPGPFEGRLSHFIRRRREELKMTRQQVADLIDVGPGVLSLIEAGHRPLDLNRIYCLADALETDRTYLCWMVVIERSPTIVQELFGEPVLADIALAIATKGGQS